jgi:hypothetical protein
MIADLEASKALEDYDVAAGELLELFKVEGLKPQHGESIAV